MMLVWWSSHILGCLVILTETPAIEEVDLAPTKEPAAATTATTTTAGNSNHTSGSWWRLGARLASQTEGEQNAEPVKGGSEKVVEDGAAVVKEEGGGAVVEVEEAAKSLQQKEEGDHQGTEQEGGGGLTLHASSVGEEEGVERTQAEVAMDRQQVGGKGRDGRLTALGLRVWALPQSLAPWLPPYLSREGLMAICVDSHPPAFMHVRGSWM